MDKYTKELEALKNESLTYFETEFDSEEAEDRENIRIKSALINLIGEAQKSEPEETYQRIKKDVINYLCEVCGHSGDLDIIKSNSPDILSSDDVEFIIGNSALSRWF